MSRFSRGAEPGSSRFAIALRRTREVEPADHAVMLVSVGGGCYMFRALRDTLLLGSSALAIMVSVGAAEAQDPPAQPTVPAGNTPQSVAPTPPPADAGKPLPTIQVTSKRAKPRQTSAPPV